MNKNDFVEKMVKKLSKRYPNYSVSVKKPEEEPVTDDVMIMFQKNTTMVLISMDTILEDFSNCGEEVVFEKIDNSLASSEQDTQKEVVTMINDYERIKDKLFIKALNTDLFRKKLKRGVYQETVKGVALALYVLVDMSEDSVISFMVPSKVFFEWKKPLEEVFACAIENTMKLFPPRITDIETILFKPYSIGEAFMENDFYSDNDYLILTSEEKKFGATAIFFPKVAERISQIMGGDYYFAATSVHEVFVHKINTISPMDIKESWSNSTNVGKSDGTLRPAEILSDRVFRYDSKKKEIVIVL